MQFAEQFLEIVASSARLFTMSGYQHKCTLTLVYNHIHKLSL